MPTAEELKASIAEEHSTQNSLLEDIRKLKKQKKRKDATPVVKSDEVATLEAELASLQATTSALETEKSDLEEELS